MAKKKKTTDGQAPEAQGRAVDLLALLVPQGRVGPHQVELEVVTEDVKPTTEVHDRPALSLNPLPSRSEPAPGRVDGSTGEPVVASRVSNTGQPDPTESLQKEKAMPRKVSGGEPSSVSQAKARSAQSASAVSAGGCSDFQPPAGDSFDRIRADILKCTSCELYKTRTNIVPGEGNPSARLVFIGEAPGADEDATGRPFVGRAGQHLDKILTAAGFRRDEVFICNILKDRPPDNRTPTVREMEACTPFLRRQLALIKPQIIGLLGNTAVKFVIGPEAPGITKIHGQWFESILGIPCMPMYHPSYLLRNQSRTVGSPNWQMWQDIQALKKRFDELAGS
ncbi:MAG TPA: uracil-DNA glycosylase [Candidatus Ozemobacteraceae bacterium]|nr:uracil-DNA glycosylase [Candidatus Ozemobacteraceae bacterium]